MVEAVREVSGKAASAHNCRELQTVWLEMRAAACAQARRCALRLSPKPGCVRCTPGAARQVYSNACPVVLEAVTSTFPPASEVAAARAHHRDGPPAALGLPAPPPSSSLWARYTSLLDVALMLVLDSGGALAATVAQAAGGGAGGGGGREAAAAAAAQQVRAPHRAVPLRCWRLFVLSARVPAAGAGACCDAPPQLPLHGTATTALCLSLSPAPPSQAPRLLACLKGRSAEEVLAPPQHTCSVLRPPHPRRSRASWCASRASSSHSVFCAPQLCRSRASWCA